MAKNQENPVSEFEELYLKERKKSSLLLIVVIVLTIATSGSLMWGVAQQSNTSPSDPALGKGFEGRGQFGRMDITAFFKDDGSLDTERIDEITNRSPSGVGSPFIDKIKEQATQAVKDGKITQEQADALTKKLESVTESSDVN